MSGYYVSRQSNYYDGGKYSVEIAAQLDVSGPGALVPHYERLGEGDEFDDPREAAKAAVAIAQEWGDEETQTIPITLAMSGMIYATTEDGMSPQETLDWGEKAYSELPLCEECGHHAGVEEWTNFETGDTGMFCSEECAELVFGAQREPAR